MNPNPRSQIFKINPESQIIEFQNQSQIPDSENKSQIPDFENASQISISIPEIPGIPVILICRPLGLTRSPVPRAPDFGTERDFVLRRSDSRDNRYLLSVFRIWSQ